MPSVVWPFDTKQQPFGPPMSQRVDQGWDLLDIHGGSNVHAILSGTVGLSRPDPGGFGNDYPYVITDAPVPSGCVTDIVYYGHAHILPGLVGKHVNAGDVIATTSTIYGQNESPAPPGWLEIGFAYRDNGAPTGAPIARGTSGPTGPGQQMQAFLLPALGGGGGSPINVATLTSAGSASGTTGAPAGNPASLGTNDPIDNRPFSPYFFGHQSQQGGVGNGGKLVHGMIQSLPLPGSGSRSFACFFMLNPTSISNNYSLSPVGQTVQAAGTAGVSATAVQANSSEIPTLGMGFSFDLVFNRMYEVWQGGYGGPSDIGARWDVRALERLLGIFDDVNDPNVSSYTGAGAPTALTCRVVLGGPNSPIFTGLWDSLSSQYTMFDRNMIPIEAQCSVSFQKIFSAQAVDLSVSPGQDVLVPNTSIPAHWTPILSTAIKATVL